MAILLAIAMTGVVMSIPFAIGYLIAVYVLPPDEYRDPEEFAAMCGFVSFVPWVLFFLSLIN